MIRTASGLLLSLLTVSVVAADSAAGRDWCTKQKSIRRLDGSRISCEEASKFARETLDAHHVTGAQIAIVDGGKLVWSGAFGMRTLDPPEPMQRTTATWAASITKSVFATYVMQLAEKG